MEHRLPCMEPLWEPLPELPPEDAELRNILAAGRETILSTSVPAPTPANSAVGTTNNTAAHDLYQNMQAEIIEFNSKKFQFEFNSLKQQVGDLEERLRLKEAVIADYRLAHNSATKLRQEMEAQIHTLESRESAAKRIREELEEQLRSLQSKNQLLQEEIKRVDEAPAFNGIRVIKDAWVDDLCPGRSKEDLRDIVQERSVRRNSSPAPSVQPEAAPRNSFNATGSPAMQANRSNYGQNDRSHWGKVTLDQLPKFNGSNRLISDWWDEVESLGALYAIPPSNMVMALPNMLQGPAKDWLRSEAKTLIRIHGHNWDEWKKAMFERFHDEDKKNAAIIEYLTLNFKNFKSIKKYMSQKYFLRATAYGGIIPEDQSDTVLITQILQLFPSAAKTAIKTSWMEKCMATGHDYRNTPMAWGQFLRLVEDLLSTNLAVQQYDPCVMHQRHEGTLTQEQGNKKDKPSEPFNARCRFCGANDHATTNCVAAKENKLFCATCKRTNHTTEMHRPAGETRQSRTDKKVYLARGSSDSEEDPIFPTSPREEADSDEEQSEQNFL